MEVPTIKRLNEAVINRIAAGEVIQRPANALKELIENSLDAKSTNIQVSVKQGGLKHLQIQDNGTGIRKADLEIVCERFTTSKLREFEDLNTIATYGFRGEALASISHVAHLTIQTKTADEKCAYKASYVDGKMQGAPKPTAGNQGTVITVEDLFYNMAVRKRALRSPAEEYQKVSEVVGKYAVHNALVGFCLKKSGENTDIRTPQNSTHVDNIRTVYGHATARELIEFELRNEPFRFTANGFMTNVNYSTKKFTFLLFINHRLVDCQSLKRCVDQVYSTYLPKGMHPFVYLSLEIDPKTVDVNVHPTKHEVHFLNEDRIVELISAAVEGKLLGCNNSRMYYTQAKLPNVRVETHALKDKSVCAKDLVRTDRNEQKLEKFFGASTVVTRGKVDGTCEGLDESDRNAEVSDVEMNDDSVAGNESFENRVMHDGKVERAKDGANAALVSKVTRAETKLTSVLELRKEVEGECHKALRELFSQHVFVGCVDRDRALVQHGTKLYLCHTRKIMTELFYQFVLYNFQNFDKIVFSEPLSVYELAVLALNLPETGWTPEDGDKEELAGKIVEILTEKGEMLEEYFSMEIDEEGRLLSLPHVLANFIPEISGLPMYVLRLATEVDWESEKGCFESFSRETAQFYAQFKDEGVEANWKWTTEHVFYPAIKEYFLPPRSFTENAAVLEIASLPNLYKVFERC